MFINIEATRQRLADDKEELEGLFTSLGYREGLYWVEHDASRGELDFVSDPDFYRTIRERAKGFNGVVPIEVLYNQLGLSAVFRKILADRTSEDFPRDAIVYFEQGFVDAVRDVYPYIVDEADPSELVSVIDDGEDEAAASEEVLLPKEEDEENDIHGAQESQG